MNTWGILRAAGIGAYLMLFATVAWGVVGTTSFFGRRVAKSTAVAVHQFASTVAFVLLVIHLVGVVLDRVAEFDVLDVLVPLRAEYRPAAVALGIAGMYATVIVLVSSWVRRGLSNRLWRNLHLFAVPAFTLSLLHGVFTGTDTVRQWMWWVYAATGCIVLFLVLLRGLAARPQRGGPEPLAADEPAAGDAPAGATVPTRAASGAARPPGDSAGAAAPAAPAAWPALGDAFAFGPPRERTGRGRRRS